MFRRSPTTGPLPLFKLREQVDDALCDLATLGIKILGLSAEVTEITQGDHSLSVEGFFFEGEVNQTTWSKDLRTWKFTLYFDPESTLPPTREKPPGWPTSAKVAAMRER